MEGNISRWRIPINEGPVDRAIRIIVGLVGLALVLAGPKSLWGLFGLIPLITGLVGYCPLYTPLRLSTIGTPHRV